MKDNLNQFVALFESISDALDQAELENIATEEARKVCLKHRPLIKGSAESMIQSQSSSKRRYVNCFTTKRVKDEMGRRGFMLRNRIYQLSHLINEPHRLWTTGGYTHNNYLFWQKEAEAMRKEYAERISTAISRQIRKGIK